MDRLSLPWRVEPCPPRKAAGLPVLAAVLALAACTREPNRVETDVQSIKDRTVPRSGRLIPGGSRRDAQKLRVSWDVEAEVSWSDYAAWVETRLPEYRLVSRDADTLCFGRTLEGDAYSVTFKRSPRQGLLLVQVSFWAVPF